MYEDMLDAAESAFNKTKTASARKVAFEPALGVFISSFVTLMAAKWLGNRGKEQAQNLTSKAEEALAQKGVTDLATLDKYAQESGKNRWQAVVGLVGREVALAAAMTVGVSVQGMLQKMNQTADQPPAAPTQVVKTPQAPQVPEAVAQAPAQQQYDDVKDPFYEAQQVKNQEKQREKQQMEVLQQQDKEQPQRQQNVV